MCTGGGGKPLRSYLNKCVEVPVDSKSPSDRQASFRSSCEWCKSRQNALFCAKALTATNRDNNIQSCSSGGDFRFESKFGDMVRSAPLDATLISSICVELLTYKRR